MAFAGGISFVGLIAPHLARRLVGASYGAMLPLSGLLGAVFVMVADMIGQDRHGAGGDPGRRVYRRDRRPLFHLSFDPSAPMKDQLDARLVF